MRRPTVMHVARDWVRPSERFVTDLVGTTTATRAVVACGRRLPGPADDLTVPVRDVGGRVDLDAHRARDRRRIRAGLLVTATRTRADLVHAHFGYWARHAGRVAGVLGLPWVLSLHGHDLLVEDPTAPEPDVLRRASLVVVPSTWLADAASRAGFPDDRITVLPSGVDLARLPFRERRLRTSADGVKVVLAGRFVAKKGMLEAVDALAAARRQIPGLSAVFVGSGPLEADLRAAIERAGLPAQIRDGTAPGAVTAAFADAHLLVVPSRTAPDGDGESLGLVAIEAQACGLPVIASRHGGLVEAVAADAGRLVPEEDPRALAAALIDVIGRAEQWPAMGRAGRRHVAAEFELGARTAAMEAAYLELVAGGRAVVRRRKTTPEQTPPPTRATVVMVTHNRRDMCRRSVAALRRQTHEAFDVVIVDNASTDGTAEDLRELTAAEPRVRVVTAPSHWPPAAARNRAVAISDAEIVAFTDDDCYPTPTWLEALVAGLSSERGPGIVQGRTTADPSGWLRPLSRTQWTPAEYGLYETANIAYRRGLLGDRPFDEDFARRVAEVLGPRIGRHPFGEDTELAWRVKREGTASAFAATAVVHHAVHDPDPRYLLRRAVVAAGFPLLVRQVPELRDRLLWRRRFLGARHAAVLAAASGGALSRRAPIPAAVLVSPYALMLARSLRPRQAGRRDRWRAMPVLVTRDVVEVAAVAYGAVRARTLVL
jgi:glycosyltransferase involved in cell wall biosynthesis